MTHDDQLEAIAPMVAFLYAEATERGCNALHAELANSVPPDLLIGLLDPIFASIPREPGRSTTSLLENLASNIAFGLRHNSLNDGVEMIDNLISVLTDAKTILKDRMA